ncbi:MAG: Gfo/Idh/MocA family oxidoreductase [Proteobacteria bacterium]|nr:MAG: Gfo/Idh/MocA family oxidoreductase [Pseudomonadota bacterium]
MFDRRTFLADMYGVKHESIYNYQNFYEIKNNPEVQVVYIVLPNGMHHEFTLRSAKAGKHVLCEKPMANTVKEAEEMVKACADAKVKLMIAYRIQYEPKNREAKRLIREKAFGPLKILELSNCQNETKTNLTHWRQNKKLAGGGALPDIGLYCLNTARFQTGEEPIEVGAMVSSNPKDPRFKEVEETVIFWLRFPSGVIANCLTSYSSFEVKRWLANFDGGQLEMDPGFSYNGLRLFRSRVAEKTELKGIEKGEITLKEVNQFAAEMDHFSDCVVNNKKPYTPGEEGLQDQRIMAAIYEAAAKQAPVKLKEFKGTDVFRGPEPVQE